MHANNLPFGPCSELCDIEGQIFYWFLNMKRICLFCLLEWYLLVYQYISSKFITPRVLTSLLLLIHRWIFSCSTFQKPSNSPQRPAVILWLLIMRPDFATTILDILMWPSSFKGCWFFPHWLFRTGIWLTSHMMTSDRTSSRSSPLVLYVYAYVFSFLA